MAHKIITILEAKKTLKNQCGYQKIGKTVAKTPTVESVRTLYFYQEESGIVDMDLCEIITCEEDSMPDYEQGKVFMCVTDQDDKIKV